MAGLAIRSTSVSVVVLHLDGATPETLLLKRNETLVGEWCQVAGGIEAGETAVDAAKRELLEETGLRPARFFSADFCENFYDAERDELVFIPVFVAFVRERDVALNPEHSDFCWMDLTEAIEAVPFAGQRAMLRHINAEFVERQPDTRLEIKDPTQG
ncbi:MAG: NUDIX domain-containing protein [Pseudomonadota bacterium]